MKNIYEDAETDLEVLTMARRAGNKLVAWLEKNKYLSFKEIPDIREMYLPQAKKNAFVIYGETIGIRDITDLYIFFNLVDASKTYSHRYSATTAADMEGNIFKVVNLTLVMNNPDGPIGNLTFTIDWDSVIHEFVHVIDYQRGYIKTKIKQSKSGKDYRNDSTNNPRKYFNSDIEFNAYYTQGLSKIIAKFYNFSNPSTSLLSNYSSKDEYIKMMQEHFNHMSYPIFKKNYSRLFDHTWFGFLSPRNRKRFNKRFYKLYVYISEKWPNMKAIEALVKENNEDKS